MFAARCDACSRNRVKRRSWSGGAPRHSLPSSPFFHVGFAPVDGSFSLVSAGFPLVLSFAAVLFCWVLEAGLNDAEPLLQEEPAL